MDRVGEKHTNKKAFGISRRLLSLPFSKRSHSASDLSGTQAAGAYSNRLVRAVVIYLDFSDVGLPHSVGRAMRMGNLSAENNAFSANAALSHLSLPPS